MLLWIQRRLYAVERARVMALIMEARSYYDERVFSETSTTPEGRMARNARTLLDRLLYEVNSGAEPLPVPPHFAQDVRQLMAQPDMRPLDQKLKDCKHNAVSKDGNGNYRCVTCERPFKVVT